MYSNIKVKRHRVIFWRLDVIMFIRQNKIKWTLCLIFIVIIS